MSSIYQEAALDSFFKHSRASVKAVQRGILALSFDIYPDVDAYEEGGPFGGPYDAFDSSKWDRIRPGQVIVMYVHDATQKPHWSREYPQKDMLVLVVAESAENEADRRAIQREEEREYGRHARSHKGYV